MGELTYRSRSQRLRSNHVDPDGGRTRNSCATFRTTPTPWRSGHRPLLDCQNMLTPPEQRTVVITWGDGTTHHVEVRHLQELNEPERVASIEVD